MTAASTSTALVVPAQMPLTRRDLSLDGLRGLACLAVYSAHTGFVVRLPFLALFGWTGVHIFFVLSGYLIGRPFIRSLLRGSEFPNLRQYALRRVLRIYPPYVASLLFFLLLRRLSGGKLPDAENLLAHFLLIFNYFRSINFFSINAVYWSLAVELQFYLVLPVIAVMVRKGRVPDGLWAAWTLVGLFIFGGLLCRCLELRWDGWVMAGSTGVRFRTVFSYLDFFGMGMAAALIDLLVARRLTVKPRHATAMVIIGLLIFLLGNHWSDIAGADWQGSKSDLFVIGFSCIVCAALAMLMLGLLLGSPLRRIFEWGPLVYIGEISYSIYLCHLAVLLLVFRRWPMPNLPPGNLRAIFYGSVCFVPAIILSIFMFELVERPTLRLVARFRG